MKVSLAKGINYFHVQFIETGIRISGLNFFIASSLGLRTYQGLSELDKSNDYVVTLKEFPIIHINSIYNLRII